MIQIPENHKNVPLSNHEKRLLHLLRQVLTDRTILFMDLNPLLKVRLPFVIIDPENGVLCISVEEKKIPNFLEFVPLANHMWLGDEEALQNKFLKERLLRNSKGEVKFYLRWLRVFVEMERPQQATDEVQSILYQRCLFAEDVLGYEKLRLTLDRIWDEKTDSQRVLLSENDVDKIGFTIAPFYFIPRRIPNEDVVNSNSISLKESYLEASQDMKVLKLDHEQIQIINSLQFGHHLILACAGSGKSAMLIAKAFKVASSNPDTQVLLTCYNRNLASSYRWQIAVSGFRERNVQCRTFHSLCRYLLEEASIPYPEGDSEKDFEEIFRLAKNALIEKKIKTRFNAIFIDEIQVFQKQWYQFCYELLKDKRKNHHLFVICGDKSQAVRQDMEQKSMPWQIKNERYPNYDQQQVRIERNYRNTVEINQFVDKFVTLTKQELERFQIATPTDDFFLRGRAFKSGQPPITLRTTRTGEAKMVMKAVYELQEIHGVPKSEIAILFPQRQYEPSDYFIYNDLLNEFHKFYLTPSLLIDGEEKVRYGEQESVMVSTIQSALGLDFTAVVLCGLFSLGQYLNTCREEVMLNIKGNVEILQQRKYQFLHDVNQIYTGMTRAREYLYLVLTEDEKHIGTKLLLKTVQKGALV